MAASFHQIGCFQYLSCIQDICGLNLYLVSDCTALTKILHGIPQSFRQMPRRYQKTGHDCLCLSLNSAVLFSSQQTTVFLILLITLFIIFL
jgi:hypothetical protein